MDSCRKHLLFLPLLMLILFLGAGPRIARAADIHWYSNLQEASSAALEMNKPMMIDFQADWCAACKVMERDVYSDANVAEAFRRLLPVRLDFDKKAPIARKYEVTALPTLIFTDSYGNEILRWHGFIEAKPLTEVIQSLPDVTELNQISRALEQNKNDFQALQKMGEKLRSAGLFLTSNGYYARALDRPEAKSDPAKKEFILNQMALNSLDLKDGKRASEILEKCLKEFPSSRNKAEWTLSLGRAYAFAEKKDKAKKVLESFVREHPDGPQSQQAKALLATL